MLKNFKRRFLAGFLSFSLIFGGGVVSPQKAEAAKTPQNQPNVATQLFISALGSILAGIMPRLFYGLMLKLDAMLEAKTARDEVAEYSGFRETSKVVEKLGDICDDKSEIRIHGQEKAKQQMFDVLSSVVARVDDLKHGKFDKKDMRGNIVYIIGPSGTGKTKLCYAIADAFLKHPEKTSIFCHSESITGESELGTQLFKTILTKDIGEKRMKNWFTGSDGLIPKDEESPMLKHLLQWYESVVIIDEYDKMKCKSAKPGTTMTVQGVTVPNPNAAATSSVDNSADEIFRSIASTGKYKFMNKEVDCSKALFLITTNETREELEKNFGIEGTKGGGSQRLSIIEFDYLSKEACRNIVDDTLSNLAERLTDNDGPYKLSEVVFGEKSRDLMAEYMFNDKVAQGRVKNKFEDEIRGLMARHMGKDWGKKIEVSFSKNEETGEYKFSRHLVE